MVYSCGVCCFRRSESRTVTHVSSSKTNSSDIVHHGWDSQSSKHRGWSHIRADVGPTKQGAHRHRRRKTHKTRMGRSESCTFRCALRQAITVRRTKNALTTGDQEQTFYGDSSCINIHTKKKKLVFKWFSKDQVCLRTLSVAQPMFCPSQLHVTVAQGT